MAEKKKEKIRELRNFDFKNITIREVDGEKVIEGYAAVFDKKSEEMYGFIEVVRKGAFKKTLKENNRGIRSLWNHDSNYPIASVNSKTLELKEDEKGLFIRIKPAQPLTTTAEDLIKNLASGLVEKMSFGFNVIKDAWTEDKSKKTVLRELLEVELWEVSPLGGWPAYPDTEIGLRGLADAGIDQKELNIIIMKANNNIELNENEIKILNKHSEIIRSFLPEEPADDHSSDTKEPRKLTLMRIKRAAIKTQSILRRK